MPSNCAAILIALNLMLIEVWDPQTFTVLMTVVFIGFITVHFFFFFFQEVHSCL